MHHPILRACADITATLKDVAAVNPTFMTTSDKAEALRELTRAEARLVELRLRVMADAGDVAATTAAHDVAEWLTVHTRARHEDARADLRLSQALDQRYPVLAAGLRHGEVTPAQAHVIARALDDLPAEIPADVLAMAEATLTGHADEFGPGQLARLGRRVVEVVAPQLADATEARRLAQLEADAHRATRLTLRRVGDGTTRLSGLIPDAAATRLATHLEAFTNPRKDSPAVGGAGEVRDPLVRPAYPRRLGQAFCQLLEVLDPGRIPLHGGDATAVVVTIPLADLLADLGTADLTGGHVAGDGPTDDRITAAQARRLACTAGLIPAVLGGDSEVLDLGRSARLYSAAQRRALRLRDRTCRAEGCTIPAAWCEAHHAGTPWARGGRTDLADGTLLCSHHHHRAHDPTYQVERLPNGDHRYHRRR